MPAPLAPSVVQEILNSRSMGLSCQKIASILGVNKKTVISYCNPVAREKARTVASDYRQKHPDRVRDTHKRSHQKHRDKRLIESRAHYETNRDRILKQKHQYYISNIDKKKEYNKSYYKANQARLLEYARSYRLSHRAEILRKKRLHYKKNTTAFLARNAVRRARLLRATPSWLTTAQLKEMQEFFDLSKQIKEATGEVQHVDHIEPLVSKRNGTQVACGLHVPWNLAVVPAKYNLSKNCFLPATDPVT